MKTNQTTTLDIDFSGKTAMTTTRENSIRRMITGIATLVAVSFETSRKGHECVKLVFDALVGQGQGHVEYLRMSSAENFKSSFMKLRYIFANAANEQHRLLAMNLPNPFEALTTGEGDNKTVVTFTTNEEFKALQATYGQELDWVWGSKDGNIRVAGFVREKEAYCVSFAACAEQLIGNRYSLRIDQPKEGERFQTLKSIEKAPVSTKKADKPADSGDAK